MQLPVHNSKGEQVGTVDVADEVFGIEPNQAVMHQVHVAIQANRRAGTHSTLTRGEVRGSTAKTRRQKGLGRGRQGSIRAPHHRHGGITFGPKPRSYEQAVPKMLRRLAIRSVLSAKAASGDLRIVDEVALDGPSTARMSEVLHALQVDRSAIVATGVHQPSLRLSVRNLPQVEALPAGLLNVADMLDHRYLVLTLDGVRRVEMLWGGERATKRLASAEGS